MNRSVKRLTSAALSLAMAVSMGAAASAKPASSKGTLLGSKTSTATTAKTTTTTTSSSSAASAVKTASSGDYSVHFSGNQLQFMKNGKASGTFDAKNSNIKAAVNKAGNLVIGFTKADGKGANVSLGQQKNVVFSGSFSSITVDGSVANDRSFTVGGTVSALNVNAPVSVTIAKGTNVSSLKVGNASAKVAVQSGASVSKASAVSASSISGFSGSVSKAQAVTAPKTTTIQSSSKKTGLKIGSSSLSSGSTAGTSAAGKEKVYLNMYDADDTKYTEEINYTTNNGVQLVAKDGVSLGQAIKDVKFEVTHDTDKDNDRVGGQWKWVDVASTTKTSGTYTYRFYPSLNTKYPTVDVQVKYEGSGESSSNRTLGKPSISFVGKSHGEGGNVSVEVKIPSGVDDDGTLELYIGRDFYDEWKIDEDDAGDEKTCKIYIDRGKYMEDDDNDTEVRIQAKIDVDGRKASSNIIKYRLEGKESGSSANLSGFSLSGPRSIEEKDDGTIEADVPSNVTNPKITVRVSEGKASTSVGSVQAGKTAKITVTPKKDSKDLRIAVTLRCDEGTITKYINIDVDETDDDDD